VASNEVENTSATVQRCLSLRRAGSVGAAKYVAAHTGMTSPAAGIFAALTGLEVAISAAVIAAAGRRNLMSGVNRISDGAFANFVTKHMKSPDIRNFS
jgi:hypothetical protein